MASIAVLLLLLCANVWADRLESRNCSHDSCLRALLDDNVSASASSFCSTFLAGSVTATTALPTYVAKCGTQSVVNRASSACSCLVGPQSTSSSSPTGKPTTSLATTTTSATTTTLATTTSAPSSCPAAITVTSSITITTDNVVNVTTTVTTTSNVTFTVSQPPVTDTETVSITQSPIVTTATVTQTSTATTTSTVTSVGPEPSSCSQPIPNSGFENPNGETFPWIVTLLSGTANSGGSYISRPSVGAHSGQSSFYTYANGASSNYASLMWTTITSCPLETKYQSSIWILADGSHNVPLILTLTVYGVNVGSPPSTTLEVNSTVTAIALAGVWTQVTFANFTMFDNDNGIVRLTFGSSIADYAIFFDDFTMTPGSF